MCGRYAFFAPPEAIRKAFGLDEAPVWELRYNIAPTQDAPVVRELEGRRRMDALHWGLVPFWAKDRDIGNRMINARAESVADKPSFRAAFKRRRCLVPVSGFYEWQKTADGKQPWFIGRTDGSPMGLAGLWERWTDKSTGEDLESFTIITTEANTAMRELHARMPVILPPDAYADWLDPANEDTAGLATLLGPDDGLELATRKVSRKVNSPRNEGPDLIEDD